MIKFRDVKKEDWTDIDWLASDDVQEADHSSTAAEWSENRRTFSGRQYHLNLNLLIGNRGPFQDFVTFFMGQNPCKGTGGTKAHRVFISPYQNRHDLMTRLRA